MTEAINVLTPPSGTACVGDSDYSTASGTDDAPALQAMINSAVLSGGVPVIEVPARRTYRIGSTITIPFGISIKGLGGRSGQDTAQGATFVWSGAAGGTMFDVAVAGQNIPMVAFEDITLTGRTDQTNLPATLIKFRGTGGNLGAVDSGSYLRNVWLQHCSGNALSIEGGSTNFLIENGRFDNWGGYAIYATGGGNSITIDGNHTMAMGAASNGMIFMDGETSGASFLKTYGLHLETNESLSETYSGGANPYDKRGLIRLGVNASVSSVQHHVHCSGLQLDEPFGINSHCVFQITASGTADSNLDNSRMVSITVDEGKGLERGTTDNAASDEIRILGGRVATNERPPTFGTGNFGHFHFGVGKNSTGDTIVNWTSNRGDYHRLLVTEARTVAQLPTDFPKLGARSFVSDSNATLASGHGNVVAGGGSNKVPVYWDGADYRIG